MKKRLTAAMMALVMTGFAAAAPAADILPHTSLTVSAAGETSGICGEALTWAIDSGTLTISGSGAMSDFTEYGSGVAPWTRSDVKSIVIKSGVTSVGKYAFYGCTSLKTVTIADTVKSLGDYSFCSTGLEKITLPSGVAEIGSYAFYRCSSLTDITIPMTVSRIGGRAFYSTPWFEAQRESSGTVIVNSVLVDALSAEGSYTVPAGITSISGFAFSGSGVTSVTVPKGVEHLDAGAFSYAAKLTSVTIPETVTEIVSDAFDQCAKLAEISVSADDPAYSTSDGVLYDKNKTELIKYPQAKNGSLTVPSTVKKIASGAFSGALELSAVTIPTGVTEIGAEAFYGCRRLRSVKLPDTVTTLGSGAFRNCRGLNEVTLGSGLKILNTETFSGCRCLRKVTLGVSIASIGESCFNWCDQLTEIAIPDSVSEIGQGAFWCCTDLKKVTLGSGLKEIASQAFYQCYGLSEIGLPEGLEKIGSQAFGDCTSLKTITIPATVTAIEGGAVTTFDLSDGSSYVSHKGAFAGCTGLESAVLKCQLTRLNQSLFYGCTSLKTINIPDTVTDIDDYAFANCASLAEIDFSEKLIRINKGAFEGCTGLEKLDLPASLKTIGAEAFMGCTGLKSVNIPEKVWKIDKNAFSGCISLTNADIPASVTTFGVGAFERYGKAKYTYELYSLSEEAAKLYDETTVTVYIKTENPDPEGFTIVSGAPISEKNMKLKDVEYKDPDDKNRFKAVDGGYLWSFAVQEPGTYSLIITEKGASGTNIGAAAEIVVRDSNAESEKWIDEIIASQTTADQSSFEKMSAVSSYLFKNFRYYVNDGKYLLNLGSAPNSPYFTAYRWDSYVSPSVLAEFAKHIGGFDEIADLYSCYTDYGYTWNNGHYLCYCAAGDKSQVYNACPASNTGVMDYTMIDFKDTSKLYKLADCKMLDISGYTAPTISGAAGSAAEKFAADNGMIFTGKLAGDVNGDGALTAADLVAMEKYLIESGNLKTPQNADLCKDGRIDTFDLVMLRKLIIENS